MDQAIKILLIDDEIDFVETTGKRLIRRGHSAKIALTCAEGLAIIASGWPEVVVLDVMLPDRDGMDLLREIKKKWPNLPVIMLTGHASMESGLRGMESGASDYCLKPIDLETLVEKIAIAHRESRLSGS
jgi:two-component system, OmpR family, response regulator